MSLDARILRALRTAGERPVSGAELAQKLGLSGPALWERIRELQTLGYVIAVEPHLGCRLVSAPDLLHADDLLSRLGRPRVVGRDIRVFQETTSTSDIVEKLARDGVKEGVVVFAETQTGGRGRLGRKWVSPPGKGLWFSVLLRPALRPVESTQLTVVSAVAVRRAIEKQTGLSPEIKWPNDILLRGRKLVGILTELNAELDRVKYIVLGIGVNVNLEETDFPDELRGQVVSLRMESGAAVQRAELAAAILGELDADYARLNEGQFAAVADEWEEHCGTIGREVVIRTGNRGIRGRAEALGEEGALLLRTEHGHLERIVGGDLTLEK
jgi:BirA family transcriptional regulator, biotin operon repressor / biotin---[acetyl-CoA-carboxylase] ligase